MKRLHIHVCVDDLTKSNGFYSTPFEAKPSRIEADALLNGALSGLCRLHG